jgi:hypothetical protein
MSVVAVGVCMVCAMMRSRDLDIAEVVAQFPGKTCARMLRQTVGMVSSKNRRTLVERKSLSANNFVETRPQRQMVRDSFWYADWAELERFRLFYDARQRVPDTVRGVLRKSKSGRWPRRVR